ncbi:MAG: glycosyl hydrolase family 18, partial [Veillonella parvula]|nr:glycosyl hydrolase family 18 [Veillonella parvula]
AWRKGFEDISTITMIQEKDLGRGIPKSPTAVVPEPVVQEAKPLTKLEQYKLRLEEKEKEKAAKAEAKRKAKEEKEAAKRKAKEEVEKVKAEKKRLEEEAKARKEHNKQTVKEQNDLYTSHSSDQNTSPKNDLIKTIQVVKR